MNPFKQPISTPPPILPLTNGPAIVDSPRIERLRRDHDIEGFWREVETNGAPLIETAHQHSEVIVTFVWRGNADTSNVLLIPNRLFDRTDPSACLLRNLSGTDVWHGSYRIRADFRCSYQFCVDQNGPRRPDNAYLLELSATGRPDPYGTQTLGAKSVVSLPQAPPQPFLAERTEVPRGAVTMERFDSRILGNQRRLWTYTPPTGDPTGLLVLLDGQTWFTPPLLPTIMDNMVSEGAIPPMRVVGVDTLDPQTRAGEMCGNDDFVAFLATELPEWVSQRSPQKWEPRSTIIAGQSFSALAALYAGVRAPQRFGNVIAQSPSLWWSPDSRSHTEPAWLTGEYERASLRPQRFHLTVGEYETALTDSTRQLADTLGPTATLTRFHGGHDFACWRGLLSESLREVLK